MLVRMWKIFKALFVAGWLWRVIINNHLTTDVIGKLPKKGTFESVLIALSFGTEIGVGSANAELAKKILEVYPGINIGKIILQEEIYLVLRGIFPNVDNFFRGKLFVVRYEGRDYLNSYEVVSEGFKLAGGNVKKVFVVSHNHMFPRVKGILKNLGAKICGYITTMDYDSKAKQSWTRSNLRFAWHEALAYIFFALKGYI